MIFERRSPTFDQLNLHGSARLYLKDMMIYHIQVVLLLGHVRTIRIQTNKLKHMNSNLPATQKQNMNDAQQMPNTCCKLPGPWKQKKIPHMIQPEKMLTKMFFFHKYFCLTMPKVQKVEHLPILALCCMPQLLVCQSPPWVWWLKGSSPAKLPFMYSYIPWKKTANICTWY